MKSLSLRALVLALLVAAALTTVAVRHNEPKPQLAGGGSSTFFVGTVQSKQQAMEGALKVSPTGSSGYPVLYAGYDLTVPGLPSGQTDYVNVYTPQWTFTYTCGTSKTTHTFYVNGPSPYKATVTTTGWYPTGTQSSSLVKQGQLIPIPALCGAGQQINLSQGAVFGATFAVSQLLKVNFRWHYLYCTSATKCTSGSWSGTYTFTPTTTSQSTVSG